MAFDNRVTQTRYGENQMSYRVIQWFTGSIAREQIRIIQSRPDLELVGAVVHHEAKVGKDVGKIAGCGPLGITTVGTLEEGLDIDADVVLFNAPYEQYDVMSKILASGKNVITPAGSVFPHIRPEHDDLAAACVKGQTTFLGTGVNPGFAAEVLPLVTSSLCANVRSVQVQEVGRIGNWDPFMLTEVMKFGGSVEELEKDTAYSDMMAHAFQESCQLLAEGLGFEVEDVRNTVAFARAKSDLIDGKVMAGSVGGIRVQIDVISGGVPVVTEKLYWLLSDELDPVWPLGDAGEWQFTINGDPTVTLGASLSGSGSLGTIATAARMVNAVQDVCDAPPGVLRAATAPMPRFRGTPGPVTIDAFRLCDGTGCSQVEIGANSSGDPIFGMGRQDR